MYRLAQRIVDYYPAKSLENADLHRSDLKLSSVTCVSRRGFFCGILLNCMGCNNKRTDIEEKSTVLVLYKSYNNMTVCGNDDVETRGSEFKLKFFLN